MSYFKSSLLFFYFSLSCVVYSQELDENKQYEVACFGFYNLENLFDTIVDPDTNKILQDDFTPNSQKQWNTKKYFHKLNNMADVISQLGVTSFSPDGVSVLGVCEIENKNVLEDLVANKKLKNRNYQIVHHEGPDRRGIDCGLLYNPKYFTVESSNSFRLTMPDDPDFASRDQLLVTGEYSGERVHFIVLHWPSRRGGEKKSRPKRIQAAILSKSIVDSILKTEPDAKVIIMGDLNDDPISPSVKEFLKAKGETSNFKDGEMFNCMMKHFKNGIGTLAYRDNWNLFDQFVLTPSLIAENSSYKSFKFYTSKIYNKEFLKNQEGNFRGYPYRTYVGSTFMGGYSDHFPVYVLLVKEIE
jgi:hypothetical protein